MNGNCSKDSQSEVLWALTTNDDPLYYTTETVGSSTSFNFSSTDTSGTREQAYTLTISGHGEMGDYEANNTPWGKAVLAALTDCPSGAGVSSFASKHITQIKFADDSNITYIGSHAFRSTGIREISIPHSVLHMGNYAMIQCLMLEDISIAGGNNPDSSVYVENSVVYQRYTENGKSGIELCFVPCARTGHLDIPDGVTVIGCNSLQLSKYDSVTIPSSVRSINSWAFNGTNLSTVTLPDNVDFGTERDYNIYNTSDYDYYGGGMGAFSGMENLTEVKNFPAVKKIPNQMFSGSGLTSFVIPEGVEKIDNLAFSAVPLKEITIPASVTTIGSSAFRGSSSDPRESFIINFDRGSQLSSIGTNVFQYNDSYTAHFEPADYDAYLVFTGAGYHAEYDGAVLPDNTGIYENLTYNTVYSNGEASIVITGFADGEDVDKTYIHIPDTINDIPVIAVADNAFSEKCDAVTEIRIGANVATIGANAFAENNGRKNVLTKVIFEEGSPITVGKRAFNKYEQSSYTVDFGEREVTLDDEVFFNTGVKSIYMPNLVSAGKNFINYPRTSLKTIVLNGEAEYKGDAYSVCNSGFSNAVIYALGTSDSIKQEVKDLASKDISNGNNFINVIQNTLCVLNGGTITDINGTTDSITKLLTPVRSGYTFDGWYTDEACVNGKLNGPATKGTTYYANWVEATDEEAFSILLLSGSFKQNGSSPADYSLESTKALSVSTSSYTVAKITVPSGKTLKGMTPSSNLFIETAAATGENVPTEEYIKINENLPAGTYSEKVSFTVDGVYYEIPVTFTIAKSDSEIKDEKANLTVTYGETLNMTVRVQKRETAQQTIDSPLPGVAYFFYDNILLGTAQVNYDDSNKLNGTATFSYDTTKKIIPADTDAKVTVQYGGSINLNASESELTVHINKKAVSVEKLTAPDKTFDNTKTVTLTDGSIPAGLLETGDTVTISSATGETEDVNAGENKSVSKIQVTLGGKDKDFYTVSNTNSVTVNVKKCPVTLTADRTVIKPGEAIVLETKGVPSGYRDCGTQVPDGAIGMASGVYRFPSAGSYTFSIVEQNGKENLDLTDASVTITVKDDSVSPAPSNPDLPAETPTVRKDGWSTGTKGDSYYKNGVKVKGWQDIGGERYYFDTKGIMQTGWFKDGENWYYLDTETGAMKTGWLKDGKQWYYLDENGVMQTGWKKVDGVWYYMNKGGVMKSESWLYENGKWYYFGGSGAMYSGQWLYKNGSWYYFGGDGAMYENRWLYQNNKWYYFDADGVMYENRWVESKGSWYYLGSSGAMLTNTTTPGGYKVDGDGKWVK